MQVLLKFIVVGKLTVSFILWKTTKKLKDERKRFFFSNEVWIDYFFLKINGDLLSQLRSDSKKFKFWGFPTFFKINFTKLKI